MATEKTATKKTITLNVGDFYPAPLSRVHVAPQDELKSERDEYVAKYEAIRFDKAKDVTLDKAIYDKLNGMYEDIKARGIDDPAQGYVEKNEVDGQPDFFITKGRQRLGLLNLMRKREGVRLEDKFIVNIIKKSDVLELLADQWASNEHRIEETFFSRAAYIRGFRAAKWTNKQIADKMKVSEVLVAGVVRVDESKYLSNLVKTRRVTLDTCVDNFASPSFLDAFRDPTSHQINEEKLEEKVEEILTEMTEKGLAHSRNAVRAFMKKAPTTPSGEVKTHISKDKWTRIAEAPVATVVPLAFHLLAKAALGEDHHTIAELIKINKDLEWLAKIEWRTAAEIKRDQKAAAAANAAANAKANEELGVVPPKSKKAAQAEFDKQDRAAKAQGVTLQYPDDFDDDDEDSFEMPEGDEL